MAHHKRRRPKNRRAGCLLCKPWKVNGFARRQRADGETFGDHRRREAMGIEVSAFLRDASSGM